MRIDSKGCMPDTLPIGYPNDWNLFANRKCSRLNKLIAPLIASLIAATFLLPAHPALADPCEDAQEYYQLWQDAQSQSAAEASSAWGGGGLFGGIAELGVAAKWAPIIANYKAQYEQAQAECDQQQAQQQTSPEQQEANPEQDQQQEPSQQTENNNPQQGQLTGPRTQDYGQRGYGPPRTGLDWQPFLANLRPKAVASQMRQGDNYANQGNWDAAGKCYDLARRIDPNNQLALQKARDARQQLNQAQPVEPQFTWPPSQSTPTTQSTGPAPAPIGTAKVTQPRQQAPPSTNQSANNQNQNQNPAQTGQSKDLAGGQPGKFPSQPKGRLKFPDTYDIAP